MWSFDPASAEAKTAIDFLKRYAAPDPMNTRHSPECSCCPPIIA